MTTVPKALTNPHRLPTRTGARPSLKFRAWSKVGGTTTSLAALMNPYFALNIREMGSGWRFGSKSPTTAKPSENGFAKSNCGETRTRPLASIKPIFCPTESAETARAIGEDVTDFTKLAYNFAPLRALSCILGGRRFFKATSLDRVREAVAKRPRRQSAMPAVKEAEAVSADNKKGRARAASETPAETRTGIRGHDHT